MTTSRSSTASSSSEKMHKKRSSLQLMHKVWTREQCALVSVLIKEKKQLRDAVRRCEAAEERMEKFRNEPFARQRLNSLLKEIQRRGMQPEHAHELRDILDDFPEDEAAPLRDKLIEYEKRRLLQVTHIPTPPKQT